MPSNPVANQHANPLDAVLRHLAERASSARVRLWAAALLDGEAAEIIAQPPSHGGRVTGFTGAGGEVAPA
jgi:hypothetical protein